MKRSRAAILDRVHIARALRGVAAAIDRPAPVDIDPDPTIPDWLAHRLAQCDAQAERSAVLLASLRQQAADHARQWADVERQRVDLARERIEFFDSSLTDRELVPTSCN